MTHRVSKDSANKQSLSAYSGHATACTKCCAHKLVAEAKNTPTKFNKGVVIERADHKYGTCMSETQQKVWKKTRLESHLKLFLVYR